MFQMGAIMLLAFIGAVAASKLNQSVMIGYILVGIFLGPFMHISLFGFEYEGIIQDTSFISAMSKIGLVLLLFFVGLEFSFSRLKKTRTPAFLLAFINISLNMFFGFVIGQMFGWPLIDTFFLAGVLAMNSTAIAAKSLLDMKRMSNPETELILAFEVLGTFIAMIILSVGSGLATSGSREPDNLWQMAIGMLVFYSFFIIIAVWLVPRMLPRFENIKSDELFILFALGILFVSAAFAELCFVPTIIGAFFVGMVFAESKLVDRLEKKLVSVKDAFVALFFISFGMMIDPSYFIVVIPMLLVAIPLVLFSDVVIASIMTYLMGYSPRAAASVGTTIAGRAEESVLYASVGSNVKIATKGPELMPFAGAFCFIMSFLTPILMKGSARLASAFGRIMPRSVAFSASLVSRTLSKAVLPPSFPMFRKAKKTGGALVVLFVATMAILLTNDIYFLIATVAGAITTAAFWIYTKREIYAIVRQANYVNLGLAESSLKQPISDLVSRMVGGVAATIFIIAVVWRLYWWASLIALLGYFVYCLLIFRKAAKKLQRIPLQSIEAALPVKRMNLSRRSSRIAPEYVEILNRASMSDFKYRSRMLRKDVEKDRTRL